MVCANNFSGVFLQKICARCGTVFEVKADPIFCSEKCRRMFQTPNFEAVKRKTSSYRGSDAEIIRPAKKKPADVIKEV